MSLSPDEQPDIAVELPKRKAPAEQPYGIVAIMIALFAWVAAFSLLGPRVPIWIMLAFAAAAGLISYSALAAVRPRIPMLLLAAMASALGMLYAQPMRMLLPEVWRTTPEVLVNLINRFVGAVIIGIFGGWALSVEEYPRIVLPINFLLMYILMSIVQRIHL